MVGRHLTRGAIVVYESTVYPGTTEEICVPILQKSSKLNYRDDFKVGYSPERINPGDKVNSLRRVVKIVSGCDEESLHIIGRIYSAIIDAGLYETKSIKVAEAAKIIENSQRDVNIAFMNEISIILDKMNINTREVIDAASSKWNFLKFTPGLVGGHCISVDPYYFIYKAEKLGYHSNIIMNARNLNEEMVKYVADSIIKKLIELDYQVKMVRIGVVGITFKENCSDIRNSKVVNLINELKQFGTNIFVYDPRACKEDVWNQYHINLVEDTDFVGMDCIVFAVAHDEIKRQYTLEKLARRYKNNKGLIIDIKNIFNANECEEIGFSYWSL